MGIQLLFTNPLVVSQEDFNSSALARVNRAGMDVAQRGRGGKPFGPPHAGTGRPSALRVPQLVRWSVGHLHVYMEKWRITPGPSQFLRIGFNLADLGSRKDMPIWRDGGFGMANTKPQRTVMEKAADPIPASRVLLLGRRPHHPLRAWFSRCHPP